ncbi:MAG: hypothetical protein DMG09_19120 [Acidobacteria bacterium]|nr:MAG: hypothetical protein DMG09_19120 [Acidobacteriota bacterium]
MLIPNLLESTAGRFPNKDALWYKQEWMTYAQLETYANRLARALRKLGVKQCDRVALLYENSFYYVIAHFAIFKGSMIAKPKRFLPLENICRCLRKRKPSSPISNMSSRTGMLWRFLRGSRAFARRPSKIYGPKARVSHLRVK